MNRRGFFKRLAIAIAAPAVIIIAVVKKPKYRFVGDFKTIKFPRFRYEYPASFIAHDLAHDLASVQPMTGPIGQIFKLKLNEKT